MSGTQVSGFLEKANEAVGQASFDNQQPRVAFKTSMKLTLEQEKKLVDHGFKRYGEISTELGRDQSLQPTWWANLNTVPAQGAAAQGLLPAATFLGKRCRFDSTFLNDVSWRPYTMGGGQHFHVVKYRRSSLGRRICRQMIARAKKSFFGSSPWFSLTPSPGTGDKVVKEKIERIERFCRLKLEESRSKDELGRAIGQALILGEICVKTGYKLCAIKFFNTEAEVLVGVDNVPLRDQKGQTISKDDAWKDAEDGLGTQVLARDGVTQKPDAPIFQKINIDKRQVLFEGVRSEPIYYKDFLCPLTAKGVQEAGLHHPLLRQKCNGVYRSRRETGHDR